MDTGCWVFQRYQAVQCLVRPRLALLQSVFQHRAVSIARRGFKQTFTRKLFDMRTAEGHSSWQWLTASAALTRLPMCRMSCKNGRCQHSLGAHTSKERFLWTTNRGKTAIRGEDFWGWGRRRLRLPECYRLTQPPRSRNRIPPKTIAAPARPAQAINR